MHLLISWYSENRLSTETNKGGSLLHSGIEGAGQMDSGLDVTEP